MDNQKISLPQPLETQEQTSPSRSKVPMIIICILILLAGAAGGWYIGRSQLANESDMKVTPTVSVTDTTKESVQIYENENFSFEYPSILSIQSETDNLVLWEAEYPGNTIWLSTQSYPYNKLEKGKTFNTYIVTNGIPDAKEKKIESITEDESITLDTVPAQITTVSCGIDCLYHILRFSTNTEYYELVTNGAGGGLQSRFNTIVSSVTFKDNNAVSSNEWNKRMVSKVSWGDFKSFTLYYPTSWQFSREYYAESPESLDITLTKAATTLRILQAASDAASCNYPDEPQKEGMVSAYKEYIEIPKGNGITWRLSHNPKYSDNDLDSYHVCEKNDSNTDAFLPYGGFTSIGLVSLATKSSTPIDQETLKEVVEILSKIEIN